LRRLEWSIEYQQPSYHPQTNGLTERFNQTLVNILTKMSGERPEEWDEFIDAALFACR